MRFIVDITPGASTSDDPIEVADALLDLLCAEDTDLYDSVNSVDPVRD